MEHVAKRSGRMGTSALSRLFRVLVIGGVALGAGCATTQGGGKDKPDDGTSSAPTAAPASPGGVRGW